MVSEITNSPIIIIVTIIKEINECAEGTHQCDSTQICINTVGSYNCSCESEYCLANDGVTCNYIGMLILLLLLNQ